ncbi:toxic anion resistance protein [Tractidigestivibacter montrealensis]|uniref:Toxic anion resistance protein n=1 Tax=Tractidigestivibacter montrealensis TaxID=2972466 RepID=A0ABT1Z7M6_9ACTN|nr:toxic anion resistance protein [Tractidigestivibacter montrealensis]MCR9036182.1 toxic anion resistance protein [Tractidigestivibacter montrealensis]
MADTTQDFDMDIPEPELEFGDPKPSTPEPSPAATPAPADDAAQSLSPADRKKVEAFVEKIDITDTAGVLSYGVGSQRKVSEFSERALTGVRNNDLGEIGNDISSLIVTLKDFDPDKQEKSGPLAIFHKAKNNLEALRTRYTAVEKNVREISDTLEGHQRTLLKDIATLDQLYALNEAYFKELTMYVVAGKEKLEQVRGGELAQLQAKAAQTGLSEDAQAARDLAQKCDRFEKRIYDLELTRQVALQTAPQIRMVQNSDAVMAEKIQSTVVNTIPLWKNQMVIALGIEHATQAAHAQREVADMTNELLKKNADKLKVATVDAAREAERGVVDIETLKHTNEQLISTLDEVKRVQAEGREKRRQAEGELAQIEGELKAKLLEASRD